MSCIGQDFRFPLKADVYYGSYEQNAIGEMVSTWNPEHIGAICELKTRKPGSNFKPDISAAQPFFDISLDLYGRFRDDIRLGKNGIYVATTAIMVTNIRNFCTDEPFFLETSEGSTWSGNSMSTMFELRSFQPFIDPWGNTEYYKTLLYRMNDQTSAEMVNWP